MTETQRFGEHAHADLALAGEDADHSSAGRDSGVVAGWIWHHRVLAGGLLLIAAEVIWKAQFLSHLYLRRDDFVNQDIALKSPLDWRYLSQVGDGHLSPGLRGITWVVVRISLYNWGLDAGVALAFVAAASLAAFRVLRTLFGNRPAILIPLAIYALSPLTMPDLGWWWCAIESLPFQLAIFMTLNAHVLYVRTGRWQHLASAATWLAFSMLFFEKAMMLPPLLLAVTGGFLMGSRSWLAGAMLTLRRHWKAWLSYGALMVVYGIVFLLAFHNSATQPHLPTAATTWAFAWSLARNSLLTGAIGLQWGWLPFTDRLYAVVMPSASAVLVSGLMALAVVAASVMIRTRAWRAWAVLLGWVIFADMVPILVGRVSVGRSPYWAGLFGLQTRYLAEAACVLALCVGLAFLPVAGEPGTVRQGSPRRHPTGLRYASAAVVVVFVFGSIRSVQTYENVTSSGPVRSYITNVERALSLAPRDTKVIDRDMPLWILGPYFGKYNLESFVIGTLAKNLGRDNLQWITSPSGTLDNLRMFGADGKLYPAAISGVYSVHRSGPGFAGCWPERAGRIVVWLQRTTSNSDVMLHLTYIWGSQAGTVTLKYGTMRRRLAVLPGVHSAYLPVGGIVSGFRVSGLGARRMCIGAAESGSLVPFGTPIP